jgi:hypothetical protein
MLFAQLLACKIRRVPEITVDSKVKIKRYNPKIQPGQKVKCVLEGQVGIESQQLLRLSVFKQPSVSIQSEWRN